MSRERAKKKARRRTRAAASRGSGGGGGDLAERERRAAARAAARAAGPARDAHGDGGTAAEPASDQRRPRRAPRDGVARPQPAWAPVPLTEIGMLAGIVLFLVGFSGRSAALVAGIGLLAVVTGELCVREHFAGYRSHSILLGLLPVTVLHLAAVRYVSERWTGPLALVIDLALAGGLAYWLHGRYRVAQARARAAR